MTDSSTTSNTGQTGPSNMVKLGALLIVGLMLLSGVAIYFAGQNTGDNSLNGDPNAPAMVTYHAEEIQGQVTQIFSSAVVGAQTSESDKTILDEALNAIPGVMSVDSQFTKLDPADSKLTYVANVTLSEDVDKQSFVDAVFVIPEMDNPEIYFQAAISVSQTLTVKDAANKDVTITLPTAIIQAIVLPDTQVGNTIAGQFVASFQGEQMVSAYLLESQNISLSPTPISIEGTFPIASLEPQLSIAGSFGFWPDFNQDVLITGLAKVNGITGVGQPLIPSIGKTLRVTLAEADVVVDDVNAFVSAHPEEFVSVQLTPDGFVFELGNVSLIQAKEDITSVITQSAAANIPLSFTDPMTQFLVDVNVSAGPTQDAESAIHAYFASWPIDVNVEIFQNGQVAATELLVPDLNKAVAVDGGTIQVSVLPGHSIGDSVTIQINGIVVNDALVYVNGLEPALTN